MVKRSYIPIVYQSICSFLRRWITPGSPPSQASSSRETVPRMGPAGWVLSLAVLGLIAAQPSSAAYVGWQTFSNCGADNNSGICSPCD